MKLYKRVILYYFTGTGNALKAGKWICEEADKMNITTSMYPIDNDSKVDYSEIDSKTLIGFLAPTHGFSIAPAMLKFILKFPSKIKSDVFILNTRGGLKFGKLFLPGLSGAAQFFPMIILKLKGYRIIGGLPLDMPSNWLFLHSGLKKSKVESIVNRCEIKTKQFAADILTGKKVFFKMLLTLPIDLVIFPISIMYHFYARFIFAKTMIYTSNCNNCKICVDHCPVHAIRIKHDRPCWTFSCEGCMRCINICPRTSIQTSHLLFVLIMIVPTFIFNSFLIQYLTLPEFLNYSVIKSIIEMALTLFEFYILYSFVQRFLKTKIFGNIFKYTSFSNYWRRYLAPGISIKNFKKNKK